jgi:hypothetical protein
MGRGEAGRGMRFGMATDPVPSGPRSGSKTIAVVVEPP